MSPDIRIAAPHCYTYRTESPLHSEFVGRPPATLEKRIPINHPIKSPRFDIYSDIIQIEMARETLASVIGDLPRGSDH